MTSSPSATRSSTPAWPTTSALVCFWAFSLGCGWVRGCERGTALSYIDLRVSPQADAVRKAELEAAVRANLHLWPDFTFRSARPDEPEWQAKVALNFLVETTTRAQTRRSAGIDVVLRQLRPNPTQLVFNGVVTRDNPITWNQLTHEAVAYGLTQLERIRVLSGGDDAAVISALGNNDPTLRTAAIRLAAERKLKGAVPGLTQLVQKSESQPEIVEAIAALIAIGDPKSAKVLIDAGRQRPPAYLMPIIYGLGKIGGREAEAYLFTVQSGHPEAELRKAAAEALDALQKTSKTPQ